MQPILEVIDLHVSYKGVRAVQGVTLAVNPGRAVAVVGPNGAGKTSLMHAIAGFVSPDKGEIRFAGNRINSLKHHQRARKGIAIVPAERWLFGSLTVDQNLRLGLNVNSDRSTSTDPAYEMFPELAGRRQQAAGTLSGGQQQMLAIARALLGSPKLLILDEPSLGLAPILVDRVYEVLSSLKASGLTLVVVEERTEYALELCDDFVALYGGQVTASGNTSEDLTEKLLTKNYLG